MRIFPHIFDHQKHKFRALLLYGSSDHVQESILAWFNCIKSVEDQAFDPIAYQQPTLFNDSFEDDVPILIRNISEKRLNFYKPYLDTWSFDSPMIFTGPNLRSQSLWVKMFTQSKDLIAIPCYPITLDQAYHMALRLLQPLKQQGKAKNMANFLCRYPWPMVFKLFCYLPVEYAPQFDFDGLHEEILYQWLSYKDQYKKSIMSHLIHDPNTLLACFAKIMYQGWQHYHSDSDPVIFFQYQKKFHQWIQNISSEDLAVMTHRVLYSITQYRSNGWLPWPLFC